MPRWLWFAPGNKGGGARSCSVSARVRWTWEHWGKAKALLMHCLHYSNKSATECVCCIGRQAVVGRYIGNWARKAISLFPKFQLLPMLHNNNPHSDVLVACYVRWLYLHNRNNAKRHTPTAWEETSLSQIPEPWSSYDRPFIRQEQLLLQTSVKRMKMRCLKRDLIKNTKR